MPEQAPWKFQKIIKPLFDPSAQHTVLTGRVLSCRGNEVIEDGFVELADGKITAVGAAAELGSRRAAAVVTAGTILPGLFNNHAHLGWDGIHDLANQSINDAPEISAYKCAGNMRVSLRAGVTTVRDLGMNNSNLFAKQAVAQGIFPGPRLLVCGQAIIQTAGHTYWCCREASGPDEMRRAVREQVRAGVDLIKITGSHDRVEMTDEELAACVDEAHRNGLPVTAHATFDEVINRVVRFGTDAGSLVVGHGVIVPEMKFMIQIGLCADTYDAIHSATTISASLNKLADKVGTLEAGKLADLIVVEGNPLQDIEALAKVKMTLVDGKRLV